MSSRWRFRLVLALAPALFAAGAGAQGAQDQGARDRDAPDLDALWQRREAQRFENQRRDCAAQWEGLARKDRSDRADDGARAAFIEECAAAARFSRCHPPGHNPTCRYEARERRKARSEPAGR